MRQVSRQLLSYMAGFVISQIGGTETLMKAPGFSQSWQI